MFKIVLDESYPDQNRIKKSEMRQKHSEILVDIMQEVSEENGVLKPQQIKVIATERFLQRMGLDVLCVETVGGLLIAHKLNKNTLARIRHTDSLIKSIYDLYFRGAFDSARALTA